jgi:hypothetical protein
MKIILCALLCLVPARSFAQVTELVPDGELKAQSDENRQGWDGAFGLNGNLSLVHNRKVVGQVDGFSFLFGTGLLAGLDYLDGPHEWINTLSISLAFARTPVVSSVVKTNDLTGIESVYAYYFISWLAAFGRINFETPLLATTDVRAEATNFVITRRDGTIDMPRTTRQRLADPFQPLTLNESVGLMAKMLDVEPARITARVGAGGRETFSRGVLVNKDDAATMEMVELLEIEHVFQFGAELALGIVGKFPEQRTSYGIDVGVLFPFVNNDPMDRSIGELIRVAVAGNLVFNMLDWLALTYQLKVLRDQQLVDDIQVQNNVLLTFQYSFLDRRKPPPPPPAVDPKLEEALKKADEETKRANEAEERARAAEERAKLAEDQLQGTPPPPAPPPEAPPPAAPPPPAPPPP